MKVFLLKQRIKIIFIFKSLVYAHLTVTVAKKYGVLSIRANCWELN